MPYLTKQRKRDGVTERLCRYCESWQPVDKFVRSTNPKNITGRLAKCKLCANADHQERRNRRAA